MNLNIVKIYDAMLNFYIVTDLQKQTIIFTYPFKGNIFIFYSNYSIIVNQIPFWQKRKRLRH